MITGNISQISRFAGLIVLGLAGPVSAQQQDWALVEAAAKDEGALVFYSNLQPNGIEPLLAEFRAAYPGISTEQVRLGSNPLIERFETEFNAKRNLADVVVTYADERVYNGAKNGWMTEWTPPELATYPAEVNYQNMMFTIQQTREAIIWNTNLLGANPAPTEWKDLFDPMWKGKVGMNPPWRSLAIQQIVTYWQELGIPDAAEQLKANDVRFFEGSGGIIQAVIRGDVVVAELSDIPLNPLLEEGAPIGFVYPESGTTTSASRIFVAKNAPHPNAAMVFTNWLMTETGQAALVKFGGLAVTRPGVAPPSKLPATSDLKNVVDGEKLLSPEKQAEIVKHWRTVFDIQ
ncbi:iron(III) transport system substrate-binding protein [Paracoccus laeviglucosivorans]|uniref:Iron(III) transport system substrate-binding protein n=2 Tax=Paracoccus laeviglucosivorans TaxID=1197861 RepID=A0A521FKW5_9RHOB|nr:iron(III) transport system substrate-binding protein [Paracoccus laeviglucosivorans]